MNLFNKIFVALLAMNCLPAIGHAEGTAETSIKIEDVNGKKNTTPGNDIDETITNPKMRAESGSKARWSMSSQLNYIGGSVNSPFSEERPNIAGATGTTDASLIGGQISGKYNLSASASLMAGVGVRLINPLSSDVPADYKGNKLDADNPYIIYQYLYKWSGIQSALQIQPQVYTNSNLLHKGFQANLQVSQNNIYELGHSGASLGLFLVAQVTKFNNDAEEVRGEQSDLILGFSPFLEYQVNDKMNLRTVTNLWNYEHTRSMATHTYFLDTITQSFGVGYALSRDVFLYPNVQFLPEDIRADRTNVALNTYINL